MFSVTVRATYNKLLEKKFKKTKYSKFFLPLYVLEICWKMYINKIRILCAILNQIRISLVENIAKEMCNKKSKKTEVKSLGDCVPECLPITFMIRFPKKC